ncbi:uncharacterized protein [Typha angustifolia]|uniref:uncharacterized protein n=1 Tax=Typha angustifolia TaxID=59011 RepID=UPI003C2F02EE
MELKSILASNSSYLFISYSRTKLELGNPTAYFPFRSEAKSPVLASHCLFGGGSITPKTKHLRGWGTVYGFMGNGLVEQERKKFCSHFFGSRANGVPQFAMRADNQEEESKTEESVAEDHDDEDDKEGKKSSDEESSSDEEESTEDEDEDEDGEDDEEEDDEEEDKRKRRE